MRRSLWAFLGILVPLLSACALGETGPTPLPVTLPPAPTLLFAGQCEITADLEDWLESTYFLLEDFTTVLLGLSGQSRAEIQDDLNRMVELRNALNGRPAPDCAGTGQTQLSDAMTRAISGTQQYINGDLGDVAGIVGEVSTQLDAFRVLHGELQARFEAEISGQ